ncbi:MAG: VWA domain-containing protein [Acidobacteria bacterium]|nr:MAG: VWA domain-containing protein [Acidobacteriota bacterium]
MLELVTMRQRSKRIFPLLLRRALPILALVPVWAAAQQSPPHASPAVAPDETHKEYTIGVDVNMVVLHATVLDKNQRMVDNLKGDNFQVYEDGVLQKISVFSHADIPVTMGIVIDDSGSMKTKRQAVNSAALTFVKTSNPQDQAFVVNFNDSPYLDTPGDFAANIEELKAALDKIDSRGGTALYDALMASLDHLKRGNRDRKVVLAVTDGEDNSSRYSFDELLKYGQKSNATIYTIGLLGDEEPDGLFKMHGAGPHHAAKILRQLAAATGGVAFFPKSLEEVESICTGIARDIRNQYTLAYYPLNKKKDGTFRTVRVQVQEPSKHTHLIVRTSPGYYAPKAEPTSASGR